MLNTWTTLWATDKELNVRNGKNNVVYKAEEIFSPLAK